MAFTEWTIFETEQNNEKEWSDYLVAVGQWHDNRTKTTTNSFYFVYLKKGMFLAVVMVMSNDLVFEIRSLKQNRWPG